jgi:hypothetical protein
MDKTETLMLSTTLIMALATTIIISNQHEDEMEGWTCIDNICAPTTQTQENNPDPTHTWREQILQQETLNQQTEKTKLIEKCRTDNICDGIKIGEETT